MDKNYKIKIIKELDIKNRSKKIQLKIIR